jgi:hypothetical protein
MEVEKLGVVNVMDRYELNEMLELKRIAADSCFSRRCLQEAGRALQMDQMLSGTAEEFGSRFVITLRLLDVEKGEFVRTSVMEYLNLENEIQRMMRISAQKLFGIEPDKVVMDQLVNIENPIISDHNLLSLNGPRFGGTFTTGQTGERMQAPKSEGGYDMFPVTFNIGYQQEWRYQSTGNFQALVEFIPMIGGLESGYFIPSITFMNGFRWGESGWEIGFGPTFRIVKKIDGYFDSTNTWHKASDWDAYEDGDNPYEIVNRMDSRGSLKGSFGLLFAVGRTFQSGYLNIPVNFFFSPRKDGHMMGVSCGFNINRPEN